ncbi:MAG: phytanoyl-CoA dioxygenase family protein [Streptosporangiaceae bacterium]
MSLPPRLPDPKDLDAFQRDGYLIVRDAIDAGLRASMARAAERLLAEGGTAGRDRSADGRDGYRGVVAMDDAFLPLVANPAVLPAVVALLSPGIHLMSSHLIAQPSIPPGDKRTIRVPGRHGWHRDMGAASRDLGTAVVPRLAIKAAYYLTSVTPDAGITMILPGSSHDPCPVTVPSGTIDPPRAITPDLGPCDALLFENRTWHAGGLNTSGRTRLAVMMQYGYRWLAPVDDPAPCLAGHLGLDDVQRQLLGIPDRNSDGSVAHEGAGASALTEWRDRVSATPTRKPQ